MRTGELNVSSCIAAASLMRRIVLPTGNGGGAKPTMCPTVVVMGSQRKRRKVSVSTANDISGSYL